MAQEAFEVGRIVAADHRPNTVAVRYDPARVRREPVVAQLIQTGYALTGG